MLTRSESLERGARKQEDGRNERPKKRIGSNRREKEGRGAAGVGNADGMRERRGEEELVI